MLGLNMMFITFFLATTLFGATPNTSASLSPVSHEYGDPIIIKNRILTEVNQRPISVLDVTRQMDMFLNQNYPQYAHSAVARYQYYKARWKPTLQQMIDRELMLSEAERYHLSITPEEVREEIQNRFGANIMDQLTGLKMSFEELKKTIEKDLLVQKIQWFKITAKALQHVTSQEIKKAYHQYLSENPPKNLWQYQFITIQFDELEKGIILAQKIIDLKETANHDLNAAVNLYNQQTDELDKRFLSVSQDMEVEEKMLSKAHYQTLNGLAANQWSDPITQTARNGKHVIRIFHLKAHTKEQAPSMETLSPHLKNYLLQEYAQKEHDTYLNMLRKRLGYDDKMLDIPDNFEPFSMQ